MSVHSVKLMQTMAASFLMGQSLPANTPYEQKTSMLIGVLLIMFAEDVDGLVERLREENGAIRTLCEEGEGVVTDAALREKLAARPAATDSLRVSVLQEENDALRALLIDLHAGVETATDAAAVALEERIFAELRRSTERRRLLSQPL